MFLEGARITNSRILADESSTANFNLNQTILDILDLRRGVIEKELSPLTFSNDERGGSVERYSNIVCN